MSSNQLSLDYDLEQGREEKVRSAREFLAELRDFHEFDKKPIVEQYPDPEIETPMFINEFWTSRQRAAHSLHEVSYRACFKPQLPRFFIERLTRRGDRAYDPFAGRGTTLIEAALLGRIPVGCDINPLSEILAAPRLHPPSISEIADRLALIDFDRKTEFRNDLLVFYHPKTLQTITNLRHYLLQKSKTGSLDKIDAWIRMVATNRLTAHSPGFFSVYAMPPNQAVSIKSQQKINQKRCQFPQEKNVTEIILKKSRSLLSSLDVRQAGSLQKIALNARHYTGSCDSTPQIENDSIQLAVTSPPFLDVVDYKTDNWLRCWFNGIEAEKIKIWQLRKPENWQAKMSQVFRELYRILHAGRPHRLRSRGN